MPGVRKSPADSNLAILTVGAPDTFRQLKDKVKGIFRSKKKDAPIEHDNGVIVDVPAVVSGGAPALDGANPAEPARVAGARADNPPNPAQTSNPTASHHDTAVATDSDTETDAPPGKPKLVVPKPARSRAAATPGHDGPVIPPALPPN